MELYKELAAMRCFTHRDMVNITGAETSAQWRIKNYLNKGYIERIRRNLYAVVSMETDQPIPNRYQIASRITEDACVSHHSALEYYGYANQVFYDVYFVTQKKVRPFDYDGLHYQPLSWRGSTGILKIQNGVRVTTLERAVVDSIADFEKIGGLEELLRCLMLIPSLNEKKLLDTLEMYERGQLYQKTGYILEFYKVDLGLSEEFFVECKKHLTASKTYLSEKQDDYVYHDKWLLYAPKDLKQLVDKGVNDYDAI